MTTLFRTHPRLTALNTASLNDPRVTVVNADAFTWLDANPALAEPRIAQTLVKRSGTPDEVAAAVAYLASPALTAFMWPPVSALLFSGVLRRRREGTA